jgi:MFS transporter, DHA2 family, multidrug resistance protein
MGLSSLSISSVPLSEVTSAVGISSFFRTLGGAIATTLAVAMWDIEARTSRSELASNLNDAAPVAKSLQHAGLSSGQASGVIERLVDVQASTVGMTHIFLYGACIGVVAAAVVWLIPKTIPIPGASVSH